MREVLARFEAYVCPVKRARTALGTQARYNHCLDCGDAARCEARLEAFRVGLGKVK